MERMVKLAQIKRFEESIPGGGSRGLRRAKGESVGLVNGYLGITPYCKASRESSFYEIVLGPSPERRVSDQISNCTATEFLIII